MARPIKATPKPVSLWDSLQFETLTNTELLGNKQTAKGPEGRRKRLVSAITVQQHLWADPNFVVVRRVRQGGAMVTKEVQPSKWWKEQGDLYALTARYGKEPIELIPGMFTVFLDEATMEPFLELFKEKVKAGEYDEVLDDLHIKICAAFQKA